ncbi:retron system putative HNH endonuclease [Archangium lipolyticum]|uniref:retron system putative HNH endonuclease n=1 Tax=Archangium lipolyticum TaxID=2970465 RepID=UPI00214A4757|nr:retron system putative HNH endonuclease [Archangium lipolyticum]
MIQVRRGRAPDILTRHRARWLKDLQRARTPEERQRVLDRYRHEDVKDALVTLFHGKCAYCESSIRHVDYGHIEHYRPKSKYPKQAFTWSNLVLACGVCNGSEHKGDAFPLKAEGGPLVNPTTEDPERHLSFEYDPVTRLASVRGRTTRGDTTEKCFGLNRQDLRRHRSTRVKQLWFIAQRATIDPDARRLLDEAASASEEYSAFANLLRDALSKGIPLSSAPLTS